MTSQQLQANLHKVLGYHSAPLHLVEKEIHRTRYELKMIDKTVNKYQSETGGDRRSNR